MPICLRLEKAADSTVAGLKAARLASLRGSFPVPDGFVITAEAYSRHVADLPLDEVLKKIDFNDLAELLDASQVLRDLITQKPVNAQDAQELHAELMPLDHGHPFLSGTNVLPIVVRSSSMQEDMADLSFAGQYDSFLDVPIKETLSYIKLCWASLYTARALSYRHHNGIPQSDGVSMAVIVQQMVRGISGVLFTANPDTGVVETLIEYHEDGVVSGRLGDVYKRQGYEH